MIYKQPPKDHILAVYKPPTWATMQGRVVVLVYYKRLDQLTPEEMHRFKKHLKRLSKHLRLKAVFNFSALRNIGADHFTLDDIMAIEKAMSDHIRQVQGAVIFAVIRRSLLACFMSAALQLQCKP